jgi:hypothetical protein
MRFYGRFLLWLLPILFILSTTTLIAAAKDDWQSDLHKWAVLSQSNPNCKVRYATGVYRPDLGDKPVWGMMTEKMFRWLSTDGAKLAPSICPVTRATLNKAEYRILFSVSPMKATSQTTRGFETRTTTEPFNANVNYSDGSRATVQGSQTSTVVVPTETTISRSSVALYMYTYKVKGGDLELISTDNVIFSRVAASGSGANASGAILGAGIGNVIRASKDRHRADKLYEEALRSILADTTQTVAQSASQPPVVDASEIIKQADSGDAKAEHFLGVAYATGQGIAKNEAEAVRWFRKAAEQGYADAQYAIGLMYGTGNGVPKDESESYFWLNLGASNLGDQARSTRDKVGANLTQEKRLEIQERCREWVEAHQQNRE